jgi:hypothetical protein
VANDISIQIEASLGDTLVKLDLAKHAVNDLGDASENAAAKQDAAAVSTGFFSGALSSLNGVMGTSVPIFGSLGSALTVLPAVIIGVVIAANALLDVFGTLVAIVADFVAPVSLVTGLLGGLAAAFVLGATKAAGGKGPFKDFGDSVTHLKDAFSNLTSNLATAFLPIFNRLVGAAIEAIRYFDKLSQMPLEQAFQSLSTKGVQMLNSFVEQVAHVVARPIRLAFAVAFGTGPGGNEVSTVVSTWWNQLTNFFFGYTKTHQIHIGRALILSKENVDGVFQPLFDWFGRHHFTKQGIEIANDLIAGLHKSGLGAKMSTYFSTVIGDSIHKSFGQLSPAIIAYLTPDFGKIEANAKRTALFYKTELGNAWDWLKTKVSSIAQSITTFISNAAGAGKRDIETELGAAWDWVLNKAQSIWNKIVSIFTAPLHIHLSIPSIPSASSILHGVTGILPGIAGNTASLAGVGGVHVHLHGNVYGAGDAEFRRFAKVVGDEVARGWRQKAGG